MTDGPPAEAASRHEEAVELRKEAYTMALYVAICLLAALLAVPEDAGHTRVTGLIWGVTVGLAAAHWFAFRVSARLVGAGTVRSPDLRLAGAQLLGAVAVAVLASVPVVLLSQSVELGVTTVWLAAFIALAGFAVARAGGATRARASIYALSVLVIGIAIAELKNVLAGH